jgi:hypothetical protein
MKCMIPFSLPWHLLRQDLYFLNHNSSDRISPGHRGACARQWWHSEAQRGRADLRLQGRPGHVRHADIGTRGSRSSPEATDVAAPQRRSATACMARPVLVGDHWACSAGYKPTLLQLFGLLQLQSIERKIL